MRKPAAPQQSTPVDLEAWSRAALRTIRTQLAGARDEQWVRTLDASQACTLHLAIFVEPYLSLLLDGTKTIESRFGQRRSLPYERVAAGDIMLLKAASGPVVGIARIAKAAYFDLRHEPLARIRARFGDAIAADQEFWEWCKGASYATLLDVEQARTLTPVACPKKDRRGWVVFPRG